MPVGNIVKFGWYCLGVTTDGDHPTAQISPQPADWAKALRVVAQQKDTELRILKGYPKFIWQ
jgi:hypothetical protein